jgi:hypothetical protein
MCSVNLKRIAKINIVFAIYFLLFISNSQAQISGCTDPLAANYNYISTKNDGSCIYNSSTIAPTLSFNLATYLSETSGLIKWDNKLWTHNDSEDINIYALDTLDGNVIRSYPLRGTVNKDWEEISQDAAYIYIGDFGNNQNGNRTDLKILRIAKNSLLNNSLIIDTIQFSYSDQNNFSPTGSNNSDFDCEAFIVSSDSIFLFTKQWVNNKTSLYSLSKTPGIHVANLKSILDVKGLITGAVYLESKRLIVLSGYSSLLEPFVYLLYDFNGSDYFAGNKRKISISLPYHQIEGITTTNGLKYYISNEYFTFPPNISIPQQLHVFDLNSFLEKYFKTLLFTVPENKIENNIVIYPNPSTGLLKIESFEGFSDNPTLEVYDYYGKLVLHKYLENVKNQEIDLSQLTHGIYFLRINYNNKYFNKKIFIR